MDRLALGRVLTALGRHWQAEAVVVALLGEDRDELTALSLLAKIKHLRGQLSQAIALWAAIHGSSRHREDALAQLMALRRLAENPERSAAEFVALGNGRLVKKKLAQFELERAFELLKDAKVADAEAACESLAVRSRGRDAETYKLATLACVWIREVSGDLDGARRRLEQLGSERGFETDVDRLTFLVRVYEQLGRPEDVRAAIKVYQHLRGRFEKMSVHAHLARLYRKMGDDRSADECAERYLVAFRRRMHKPTRDDVLRAASSAYLPIEQLRRLTTVDPAESEEPLAGPAAAALREAIWGDASLADQLLGSIGGRMVAYRGDLRLVGGRPAEAVALWMEALHAMPLPDIDLVARVIDHGRETGALGVLARTSGWADAAVSAMVEVARNEPDRAVHWHRAAAVEAAAGRTQEAERHTAKAAALESLDTRARPGRVLAAAVYQFVGKTKGMVHELWADRTVTDRGRGGHLDAVHGNLTTEFENNVRNTFLATRQYARAKFPHLLRDVDDYVYSFKVTKEDERSGGLSAGLPIAVAFLSLFVSRPVPPTVASSGAIVADAHNVLAVRNVGDVGPKIKAAYHRDLSRLVLPAECRPAMLAAFVVPRRIAEEIVRFAQTLDEALDHIFGPEVWDW